MTKKREQMYSLAEKLWPINRSITGAGVEKTLNTIKEHLPNLKIQKVPSNTKVLDWTVPKEWSIANAWIITPDGQKICDFSENNLHVVGYSEPVNKKVDLKELKEHLYSIKGQPDAIPYITSYYKKRWGFCITHKELLALKEGIYEVYIDSELFDGNLTYGELVLKGKTKKEIFLSTYICHPSMANNELSGPVVTTFLAKWLLSRKNLRYTYRIVFIPETIGSITYLSKHLRHLKKYVVAGFNISCVGDDRAYSYLPSRNGNTLSDQAALHVLKKIDQSFNIYEWKDRGSDERQYCAPGIDLPIASIMRSKYSEYEEYHTSLDTLGRVVTAEGLNGGFQALKSAIKLVENNYYPVSKVLGEPQLGKRGLYPTLSDKNKDNRVDLIMNILTWSDGTNSLLEIADKSEVAIWDTYPIIKDLIDHNLLELLEEPI